MTDASLIPLDRAPFTYKTAQAISRTEFVPRGLRGNVPAILAAIMTGRELGLGPMESLRSIDVIDGRPSPSAEWMVGRVFEAGHIIVAKEQTDQFCTVEGIRYRDGEKVATMEFTFTMDMAKRANLTGKSNWKHYPEAMLYWRAVAQLVRQFFPDVIRGIKHLPDELGSGEWLPPGYESDMVTPVNTVTLEEAQDDDLAAVDTETGEIITDAEVILPWPPEATGTADAEVLEAIAEYEESGGFGTLAQALNHTLDTYDEWTELTVADIEWSIRFLCRAMERLEHWYGENTLREQLALANVKHLSDFKKADLQRFARNLVAKAMAATRKERT